MCSNTQVRGLDGEFKSLPTKGLLKVVDGEVKDYRTQVRVKMSQTQKGAVVHVAEIPGHRSVECGMGQGTRARTSVFPLLTQTRPQFLRECSCLREMIACLPACLARQPAYNYEY